MSFVSTNAIGAFTEWRVVGEPGHGFPSYDFIWSPFAGPLDRRHDPETAAREFLSMHTDRSSWTVEPKLLKRIVTITEWEDA